MKKIDFGKDWKFRYTNGTWLDVILPHDAQLLEKRQKDAPGGSGHGFFPGNVYEYEKRFIAEENWKDQHVELLFEGIYKDATVSMNGQQIACHKYGYTPFRVSLDEYLIYGQENVLEVVADNSKLPNSRWYTGGGIFRPVSLLVGAKNNIPWQGVHISTLDINPAKILVETQVETGDVEIEILDQGKVIAKTQGTRAEIAVDHAQLWSENSPYLYEAKVTLKNHGEIQDEVVETFGIRTLSWSPKGFLVNGKNTLLRGGCVHHDNGIIGATSYAESEWRRVRILKEQGFNAIRVSHNPAATAMLDACDYYGMYVMDETFDMWYLRKTKYDYGMNFKECWKDDTKAMIDRDFNHPSVVMYSIGNEVSVIRNITCFQPSENSSN